MQNVPAQAEQLQKRTENDAHFRPGLVAGCARIVMNANLSKLGYTKLLGRGRVSQPWRIEVAEASLKAVQRISDAGGSVEIQE